MILFFDTETNGLPKNYKASPSEIDNWPRVIQLAWALFHDDGRLYDSECNLIKPDGWEIPKEDFWINHGYNTEKSMQEGIPIAQAVNNFLTPLNACKVIVAHNIDFDTPIIGAEMIRLGMRSEVRPKRICTMKASTDICQLPGPHGFKWPKLEELHRFLFNSEFDGAHDALNDVMACAKCFFEMKTRNLIKI